MFLTAPWTRMLKASRRGRDDQNESYLALAIHKEDCTCGSGRG